jgi:hypothetical protein
MIWVCQQYAFQKMLSLDNPELSKMMRSYSKDNFFFSFYIGVRGCKTLVYWSITLLKNVDISFETENKQSVF